MKFGNLIFRKFISYILIFSFLFSQTAWAFNDIIPPKNITDNPIDHIVVDPDRAGNTGLDRAQNGTPVVNINAASNGGVSANYYRDFNVNNENLILNNMQGDAGVSKLGGALYGNPNLNVSNAKAADIILNEVTSSRVSNINGYTEIFGKQAELIIANPNGIMVGGAGFINTSRLSLITGASNGLDANGKLNPFLLSNNPNAIISVVGRDIVDSSGNPVAYNLGIDMSSGNYLDLISRVVQINGKLLSSGEISVITGNDRATKTANGWNVTSTNKSDKPEFAIDSTALGGIYAGRINLIATEDGVGVRTRSDVVANIDDIKFDARGVIVIDNSEVSAKRDITISTSKTVTNTSKITAIRNLEMTAQKITNTNEIKSKDKIDIQADALANTDGELIAVGDLNLNFSTNDFESSGVLQSGGTLTLSANNIINGIGDISGKNIAMNALGNFINGTTTYENILAATNDLSLNINGNITNYGKITAIRDINMTSGDEIINGISTGSNAIINAGRDLKISAQSRILNHGYIQAIGKLFIETKSAINGDYALNANTHSLPANEDTALAPAYQLLYNDLANINDADVLSELLDNIKTEEQYYAVQARLRLVRVADLLAGYDDLVANNNIASLLSLPESELQALLSSNLGDDYNANDWQIDLTNAITDINKQISDQQSRTDDYNTSNESTLRAQYITDNGDDTGFVYTPLTRSEYATIASESYIDYDTELAAKKLSEQNTRANKIKQVFDPTVTLVTIYKTFDWAAMDDANVNDKLTELVGDNYDPNEWTIPDYVRNGADLNTTYLNSLRINNTDRNKTEQTGIHNDGRIFSGGNISLISNSVLHNNKDSLIYSNGNADFSVRNVLFNNANAAGMGIFANGTMNIRGIFDPTAKTYGPLGQLVNYNGTIESNGAMGIKATEVINYGADEFDSSQIASNLDKVYSVEKIKIANNPSSDTTVKTHIESATMKMKSDSSTIRSNNGLLSIDATNVTNYNSTIAGYNVDIKALNLLNTYLTLNVNTKEYWAKKRRACKSKVAGVCVDYYHPTTYWTTNVVQSINGLSPSQILAKNNLNIAAKKIGNGTTKIENFGDSKFLPYAPPVAPETNLQEIVRTGTIDPLADFKLPNGKYGIIKLGDILNGKYLYESDPLLVDLTHYLGSQYFMNRIGVDPYDIEAKFIGDAFVEHQMIEKSLEQIQSFQNKQMTTDQLDEYINNLYNALSAEKVSDLGLKFGVALTSDQIKKLDADIVWYVKQNLTLPDGEVVEVLVPQVYLCQKTLDELYSAALARDDVKTSIRGNNITIKNLNDTADSVLTNMGAITGRRELVISTDAINNAAMSVGGQTPVLRGGDLLVLNTGTNGVVNNIGGIIETKNANSDLIINTGELNNTTMTQQKSQNRRDFKNIETVIGDTATIQSAGSLEIKTAGDLNMAGSKIASANDSDINVGGDLNAMAIQDYKYSQDKTSTSDLFSSKSSTKTKQSLTNIGSEISTGGDLTLKTDGDATFAGATINAGKNADLDIGGNTNIIAVTDYDYKHTVVNKSSWGGMVKEKSVKESMDQTLAGASVNVRDGLTLNTGNNLNLIASDVNVGGNADINAGDSVNVLSAAEVDTEYSLYKKTNYLSDTLKAVGTLALAGVTGGTSLLVANDGIDANCSGGKCSASVEIGSKTKDESFTKTTTSVGSAINVGGDLSMHADKDINIAGSDIAVGGNGKISADNNINITESENKTEQSSSHEDTKITAGASVGNAYVDAGYAAKALYDAGDAVTKASESLKHMQDLHDQGKASSEAVNDAKLNLTMATLNLANAELGAVASVAGAASAAGTSFGTGMYTSGSVNFETNKDFGNSQSTQSVASNLSGKNLTFTSGADINQIGSNVGATDTVEYDAKNDLNILAGTDTYKTKSGTENITAGVSVGNNAVQVNAGYNTSENRTSGTTNTNSNIAAQNIVVKTGNDATFAGANVNADENLTMNIGHDLTVESKQDSDYAKGSNFGINAGVGSSSVSGGFNTGSSNHDSAWVNDITELTAKNVDITTGNKTTLTGGMIAATDENGNDTGKLNLTTNELEYSDLHDFNTTNNTGFGLSTSIGGNTDNGISSLKPDGSTTISMTDQGQETTQTTHATIGNGNITVGTDSDSDLAGLNRDVTATQEITQDTITGALDGSVTVDNRVFSESGRAEIATQHEKLGENLEQIGDGLRNNIVTKSIENAITDKTKTLGETVSDYIEQDRQMADMQKTQKDLVDALNGATNLSPTEFRDAMQKVADFVAGTDGFTGDLKLASVNGNVVGFAYQSNDGKVKNISLNLANLDMTDPNALMKTIYHETTNLDAHSRVDKNGVKIGEQTAINRGETGAGIFDLKNYGNTNTNTMDNGQWLSNYGKSDTIQSGSLGLVSDVKNTINSNGTGTPFGEIAIPVAGAGCATGVGCPVAIGSGLVLEGLVWAGVVGGGLYMLNETAKDTPTTVESSSNNSGSNKSSDSKQESQKNKQPEKETSASVNQMKKQVDRKQAPKEIDRVDKGKISGEKDHIHLKDGRALNKDGTWKHNDTGKNDISNSVKKFIKESGWKLP